MLEFNVHDSCSRICTAEATVLSGHPFFYAVCGRKLPISSAVVAEKLFRRRSLEHYYRCVRVWVPVDVDKERYWTEFGWSCDSVWYYTHILAVAQGCPNILMFCDVLSNDNEGRLVPLLGLAAGLRLVRRGDEVSSTIQGACRWKKFAGEMYTVSGEEIYEIAVRYK